MSLTVEVNMGLSRRSFLLGLASCLSLPLCRANASKSIRSFEPFSFAFISDVHLTTTAPDSLTLLQESQLFLQDVVKQLNAEKLDFVVFGGDQVQGLGSGQANWQLFLDIAQGINSPWLFILGEADIAPDIDKVKTFGSDWRTHGAETSNPYWSFDPLPGVHLIGLDTSLANTATGNVSYDQINWLKTDLKAHEDKVTIVCSHHPILPPAPFGKDPALNQYLLLEGPVLEESLSAAPQVKLALSGHVHINQAKRSGSIWYVSSPSLDVYPCAYKLFHVTATEIAMETRAVNFPALVKKAEQLLISYSPLRQVSTVKADKIAEIARGNKEDKQGRLALDNSAALSSQEKPQAKRKSRRSKGM